LIYEAASYEGLGIIQDIEQMKIYDVFNFIAFNREINKE